MRLVEPTAQRSRLMTYAPADDVSGGNAPFANGHYNAI